MRQVLILLSCSLKLQNPWNKSPRLQGNLRCLCAEFLSSFDLVFLKQVFYFSFSILLLLLSFLYFCIDFYQSYNIIFMQSMAPLLILSLMTYYLTVSLSINLYIRDPDVNLKKLKQIQDSNSHTINPNIVHSPVLNDI